MRCEPPFRCPECPNESREPEICDRDGSPMEDANGRVPRSQLVARWEAPSKLAPLHPLLAGGGLALLSAGLPAGAGVVGAAVGGVGGAVAWMAGRQVLTRRKHRARRKNRLVRDARRQSGQARPIARAPEDGPCRIKGRARVLRAVTTEDD